MNEQYFQSDMYEWTLISLEFYTQMFFETRHLTKLQQLDFWNHHNSADMLITIDEITKSESIYKWRALEDDMKPQSSCWLIGTTAFGCCTCNNNNERWLLTTN